MTKISAQLVKELRDKTSAGILDCKKALIESKGDLEKSIKWLREKGIANANKKSNRVINEGIVSIISDKNKVIIFEVNSETDFVAKNSKFLKLVDIIGNVILKNSDIKTIDEALNLKFANSSLNDFILENSSIIGEKISLRRFQIFNLEKNQSFGSYVHNQKLGALLIFNGKATNDDAKKLAMHVTAMSPKFISSKDVSKSFIDSEKEILMKKTLSEGKNKEIAERIVNGRFNKLLSEICFVDQGFVIDPNIKISKFLESKKLEIIKMIRYEVGEGIEKKVENFSDEVMKQVKIKE